MSSKPVKPYVQKQQKEQSFLVNEAPTTYYTSGTRIPLSALTSIQKMNIIKVGITKKYLESLKNTTSLDYQTLAEALSVTRATLINKKGDQKFSDQISERILTLADLYSYGYKVFEDQERFNKWIFVSNQALGGVAPIEIIDNFYDREEVKT